MRSLSGDAWAKIAATYAGLAYGVFWMPLRAIEDLGISGLWSASVFNVIPGVGCICLLALFWRRLARAPLSVHLTAMLFGVAMGLYAAGIMFTDVVRAVLLFYLTPFWGFLLARIVIGDPITPVRWFGILFGLSGGAVLLGAEKLSLSMNFGDWLALISGGVWAVSNLFALMDRRSEPLIYGFGLFVWGAALTAVMALWFGDAAPVAAALAPELWWLAPTGLLLALPAGLAAMFGPTRLNPGVVGLLFMAEVAVAAITAGLFAGEVFGLREALGVAMIMLAASAEPVLDLLRGAPRPA